MANYMYPMDKESYNLIESLRGKQQKRFNVRIPKIRFTKFWLLPKLKKMKYNNEIKTNN
jgi:hypothetical protein